MLFSAACVDGVSNFSPQFHVCMQTVSGFKPFAEVCLYTQVPVGMRLSKLGLYAIRLHGSARGQPVATLQVHKHCMNEWISERIKMIFEFSSFNAESRQQTTKQPPLTRPSRDVFPVTHDKD